MEAIINALFFHVHDLIFKYGTSVNWWISLLIYQIDYLKGARTLVVID